jgi:hypothetical protein
MSASLDEPAVIAHARLVVTSAEGHRLHEELIAAGGRVRRGRFSRLNVTEVKDALAAAGSEAGAAGALEVIDAWESIEPSLDAAIQQRGREVADSIDRRLAERMQEDAERVRKVLSELADRIRERLAAVEREGVQLTLDDVLEREQFERDVQSLRRRLDEIPDEIEREVAAIARRYANPEPRVFPAALTILVPATSESRR